MQGPDIQIETPNLQEVLRDLKQVNADIAKELRRELRRAGDDIIKEQRMLLQRPAPGRTRLSTSSGYRSRSRGMRQRIAAGLTTRVNASKSRSGVVIRTNRARAPMSIVWQARTFRHPVFNSENYVQQAGRPYFWGPVVKGEEAMRRRIDVAIDNALRKAGRR